MLFILISGNQGYNFLMFVYYRMERQRREEEQKSRSSKKALEAEQSILNRVGVHFSRF